MPSAQAHSGHDAAKPPKADRRLLNAGNANYTAFMLDREACERRVYRLALLLTGNSVAATTVISRVLDAQPDLRHLDSAHMDRLTVLRCREVKPAVLAHHQVQEPIAEALAALTPQQREAWVFARIYQVDAREMARAMDCSVTATQRHLEQANRSIAKALGPDSESAPQALLAYSMSLDVPAFYHLKRKRRRQARLAIILTSAAMAALGLAAILMWLTRPMTGH